MSAIGDSIGSLFQSLDELEKEPSANADKIEQVFEELKKKPFSMELVEREVRRGGKPISMAEWRFLTHLKRQLPDLNKALVGYELIKRETERMDLSRFRKTSVRLYEEDYDIYDIDRAEYRFFVHAAGAYEVPIESTKAQRLWSGFLCTSLISQDCSDFYCHEKSYAMVLAVDPRSITTTIRQDGYTPCEASRDTLEFYRSYQRLQILTGLIDRLYCESGVQEEHPTDSFSRLNRLLSDDAAMLDPEQVREARRLQAEVLSSTGHANLEQTLQITYQTHGLSLMKLEEMARFDALGPEPTRCKVLLEEIQSNYKLFTDHIHPIQGPGDLLNQTPSQPPQSYNIGTSRPFNEVNLHLEHRFEPGKDPIEVKAVLLNWEALESTPKQFESVLKDAKEKGIPVLMNGRRVMNAALAEAKLKRAIMQAKSENVRRLLKQPNLDKRVVEDIFSKAVKQGHDHLVSLISESGVLS